MFARLFGRARIDRASPAEDRGEPLGLQWRAGVKSRIIVVLCVLGAWTVGIEARLIHLQVFQHEEMLRLAKNQQHKIIKLTPPRGDLVDRSGRLLAYSVDANTVVADPESI